MTTLLTTLLTLAVSTALVDAGYRYYYTRPSYRSLYSRVEEMEKKIDALKQPVHVHVSGNDQASLAADGTHVHVHLSLDGKQGGSMTSLSNDYSYASCRLQPNSVGNSGSNVNGYVYLRQKPSSQIEIKVDLNGFSGAGNYGFHVHEVADFSNGCNSFGGHFNPYGKTHGGPQDEVRHVGDWGNLAVDSNGQIQTTMTDRLASLFGSESIVGRGIVVHAGTDDLGRGGDAGSLKTGNAGARLACCAIGWTKTGPWQ